MGIRNRSLLFWGIIMSVLLNGAIKYECPDLFFGSHIYANDLPNTYARYDTRQTFQSKFFGRSREVDHGYNPQLQTRKVQSKSIEMTSSKEGEVSMNQSESEFKVLNDPFEKSAIIRSKLDEFVQETPKIYGQPKSQQMTRAPVRNQSVMILKGIWRSSNKYRALLLDEVVEEGDYFQGKKVESIGPNQVVLREQGKNQIILKLDYE